MSIKLTVQEILEKEFHQDFKGYRAIEVDEFLDQVIQDYEEMTKICSEYASRINQLELQNSSLKARVMELENNQAMQQALGEEQISTVDILKRLAKLENEVYSKLR